MFEYSLFLTPEWFIPHHLGVFYVLLRLMVVCRYEVNGYLLQ